MPSASKNIAVPNTCTFVEDMVVNGLLKMLRSLKIMISVYGELNNSKYLGSCPLMTVISTFYHLHHSSAAMNFIFTHNCLPMQ